MNKFATVLILLAIFGCSSQTKNRKIVINTPGGGDLWWQKSTVAHNNSTVGLISSLSIAPATTTVPTTPDSYEDEYEEWELEEIDYYTLKVKTNGKTR